MNISYIGAGGFSSRFIHPQLGRHGVQLAAICDFDALRRERAGSSLCCLAAAPRSINAVTVE